MWVEGHGEGGVADAERGGQGLMAMGMAVWLKGIGTPFDSVGARVAVVHAKGQAAGGR